MEEEGLPEPRQRRLTEKGQGYNEERCEVHKTGFSKAYDGWKTELRIVRKRLMNVLDANILEELKFQVEENMALVQGHYNDLLRLGTPEAVFVQRMDTCQLLTNGVLNLIASRSATEDQDTNIKADVREVLSKENHASVFGDSISVVSGAAEPATPEAANDDPQTNNPDDPEALNNNVQMTTEENVTNEVVVDINSESSYKSADSSQRQGLPATSRKSRPVMKGEASCSKPLDVSSPPFVPSNERFMETLARTFAESAAVHRLPIPEPPKFDGNPLAYLEWKTAFIALIDKKPISASERMFFLKTYLKGQPKAAVEGYSYLSTEDAYRAAWHVLDDRYGDPFVLQRAYRQKLDDWPKLPPNNPLALREFADYIQACSTAKGFIKGLSILDDCNENLKIVQKIPSWLARKWNRTVMSSIDDHQEYPSFEKFAEFVKNEARIVCNPMMLAQAPSTKKTRSFQSSTLATDAAQTDSTDPKKGPCIFCEETGHWLTRCPKFETQPLDARRSFVRTNYLCFGCLGRNHLSKNCKRRHTCKKCSRQHPTLLHSDKPPEKPETATKPDAKTETAFPVNAHATSGNVCVSSSIVPVYLTAAAEPHKEVLVYALLDTQSDSSFIKTELAEALSLEREPVRLNLSTMTSTNTLIHSCIVRNLQIRSMDSNRNISLKDAYTRDLIPVDKAHIPTRDSTARWPHLQGVAELLPPLQPCDIGLLIGCNCPAALTPLEVVSGGSQEPFALKTELGWSVIGPVHPNYECPGPGYVHRTTTREILAPEPADILKALEADFSDRNIGEKSLSQEDMRFMDLMKKEIRETESGHLEMPLPFKTACPQVPDNYKTASFRLAHLQRKLETDEDYKRKYCQFMDELLDKGYAERAPEKVHNAWYLPHHGVFHPKKPGRLRIVFDCAARHKGMSLNDLLLTGPELTNTLLGVLCRFRKENIAVICDVEKMFFQFRVPACERDFLRFLWWEDHDCSKPPAEFRMTAHLFGASSSPACANFGLKFLAHKYQEEFPVAANFIARNFYVDDGLGSVATAQEGIELVTQAQALCMKGGLRLHKFNSNNDEVLSCVPEEDRSSTGVAKDLNLQASEHALGVKWNLSTDSFNFVSSTLASTADTRRGVLSAVASVFDPLGLAAPFVLLGKQILQDLCRRKMDWDEPLPSDLMVKWIRWKSDLRTLETLSVPRCYKPLGFCPSTVELHHFSDASQDGYGACSYLCYQNEHGDIHCPLRLS